MITSKTLTMNKLLVVIFLILHWSLAAQTYIEPTRLEVGINKTTNLVFPAGIVSVDRGNQNIVVQKSAANILRVKAQVAFSEETNLTVVTSDGKLYSFIINYHPDPAHLNINMSHSLTVKGDSAMLVLCSRVLSSPAGLYRLRYVNANMYLTVAGFYIYKQFMFCRLRIENRSQIAYDIEQFRLYIRDSKLSKRTSSQETEIKPMYISGDTAAIAGKSGQTIVVAVPKFTIPDGKHLAIEIMERNGGRNLAIKARNRHVVKAVLISTK
ncbi:MAG: conjugative transposon protein TraN [Chitinophagaceae bacterium]|nr:MAG: conjugative transposon protein TraN [Chitinophagaceae bacterium]